jgi:hypothetical protein
MMFHKMVIVLMQVFVNAYCNVVQFSGHLSVLSIREKFTLFLV